MRQSQDRSQQAKANLAKLPEMCAVINPLNRRPILLKAGQKGFYPYDELTITVREFNESLGVEPAQVNAMYFGSLFGFDVPGADPDNDLNKERDPYSV